MGNFIAANHLRITKWSSRMSLCTLGVTLILFVHESLIPAQTPYLLQLTAGTHRIDAEIAATLPSRNLGLANRPSLPENQGMLFIYPEAHRQCMWMRNTHIPLSAAFLDDTGEIINIADMYPDTDDLHCAGKPVRYVLEMPGGWFGKRGISPGLRIQGLENAPSGS